MECFDGNATKKLWCRTKFVRGLVIITLHLQQYWQKRLEIFQQLQTTVKSKPTI